MRANELMIGNFVYIKNRRVPEIVRVSRIDGRRLLSPKLYNPIPITEEWLTKQGFKREYDCICEFTYYIREIDGFFVEVKIGCSNMGDEYVNCHIDNCDRNSVASADIQYVHQLQNLLNIMDIKL